MPHRPSPENHADSRHSDDLSSLLVQLSLDLQAIQRLALVAQQADLSTDDRIALARATQRLAGSAGFLTDAAQWPDPASMVVSAGEWLDLPCISERPSA